MHIPRAQIISVIAVTLLLFMTYYTDLLDFEGNRITSLYNESRRFITFSLAGGNVDEGPSRESIPLPVPTRQSPFPYRFLINPDSLCRKGLNGSENLFLVILVCTSVRNKQRRDTIRNTWGSVASATVNGCPVQLAFLVGLSVNKEIQKDIEEEAAEHSDIIQQDFVDTYHNLTIKSVMMLRWVAEYCPNVSYVLKTDDDMYVNVLNLINALLQLKARTSVIYGELMHGCKPQRSPKSKWFVSKKQFERDMYPDFLSGTAYVMSGDSVSKLLNTSNFVPFLYLEDVFITGLCAEQCNVTRLNLESFSKSKRPATGCAFKTSVTGHFVSMKDMYKIWKELHEELECG